MPHPIFGVLMGSIMITTIVAGPTAAAAPPPPTRSAPPARVRVTIDVIYGLSGRMLCLTPSGRGTAFIRATTVTRRTCLSERGWGARHVLFTDA